MLHQVAEKIALAPVQQQELGMPLHADDKGVLGVLDGLEHAVGLMGHGRQVAPSALRSERQSFRGQEKSWECHSLPASREPGPCVVVWFRVRP